MFGKDTVYSKCVQIGSVFFTIL